MRWSGRWRRETPGSVASKISRLCSWAGNVPGRWTVRKTTGRGRHLHLHNLTDLRLPATDSRRSLHGLPCGRRWPGICISFDRFEPPLFCKRDNSGNLSPPGGQPGPGGGAGHTDQQARHYRAPYNGAIQRAARRVQELSRSVQWKAGTVNRHGIALQNHRHNSNHQPRRCLGGQTACTLGGPQILPTQRASGV